MISFLASATNAVVSYVSCSRCLEPLMKHEARILDMPTLRQMRNKNNTHNDVDNKCTVPAAPALKIKVAKL